MHTLIPVRPYVVRACLALTLAVLALFVVSGASSLRSSAAPDTAPSQPADDRVFDGALFLLTWSAQGSGSGERHSVHEDEYSQFSVGFQGEALIRYRWDPVGKYLKRTTLFTRSNITRNWDDWIYPYCDYEGGSPDIVTLRQWVLDPSGGTGTFLPALGLDPPQQRADGSWYITDPFSGNEFWAALNYLHVTVMDNERREYRCTKNTTLDYTTSFSYGWDTSLESPGDLSGDSTASMFSHSASIMGAFDGFPMAVSWTVSAQRLGECTGLTPPIQASSAVIKNLDVKVQASPDQIPPNKGNTLDPPDPSTLTIKVTCDGVAVTNAELRVEVIAEDNSGGHVHGDGGNPRPRGYLKRSTDQNYTKITRQKPSITVKTDDKGEAKVSFLPGRDLLTGLDRNCAGEQRGIAGTYKVTATPTDARFSAKHATQAVEVARTDFLPLPAGDHYVSVYSSAIHPNGTSGTQATFGGLQGAANQFYDIQLMHNKGLTETGKAAWPIVDMAIIDISLEDGGLFDTGGTNMCLGGVRSPFVPWKYPHQTHLNGAGVDMSTAHWPANAKYQPWWREALREAGCFYGTWEGEKSFHLNVDQNSQNWGNYHSACLKRLPSGTSVSAGAPGDRPVLHGLTGTSPDLFANVEVDGPDEQWAAAPGQVLTYTLGLSNLNGGADAHNVVLTGTLPTGLGFVGANPPATRVGGGRVAWDVGTLPAGTYPRTFDLATQIGGGVVVGTELTITAQTSTTDAEATLDNNWAESFPIPVQAPGPDLVVYSDIDGKAMVVGEPVSFTVEVENVGTTSATSAALTLTLPASVTLSSAAPLTPSIGSNGLVWPLGDLAPYSTRSFTVAVALDPRLDAVVTLDPEVTPAGLLTFTLSTASTNPDLDPANNVDQVVKPVELAGPDAAIWVGADDTGNAGSLSAGQDLTFTLRYGNFGNQVAATTTLTLSLWSGLDLIGAQPSPNRVVTSTVFGGGVSAWLLGNLAVGQSGRIDVRVHVSAVPPEGSLVLAAIAPFNRDILPLNNAATFQWSSAVASTRRSIFLPVVIR